MWPPATFYGIITMKNITALLQQDINTVKVIFERDGKEYQYKTNLNLEVGDPVVVKVKSSGQLKVVKVVQVDNDLDVSCFEDFELQWIVQRVNLDMYDQLNTRDDQMTQMITKLEIAKKRAEFTSTLKENLGNAGMKLLSNITKTVIKSNQLEDES